jgi:hypothetical protein
VKPRRQLVSAAAGTIAVFGAAFLLATEDPATPLPTPADSVEPAPQARLNGPTPVSLPPAALKPEGPLHDADLSSRAFGGVKPVDLLEGEPLPLPGGMTLFLQSGRSLDDGPVRIELTRWRRVDGALAATRVFGPLYASVDPSENVYSWAGDDTMTVIWAATCGGGWCGRQPSGGAADGRARMYRSVDGGVSWTAEGTFDPNWYVAGVHDGTAVMVIAHWGGGTNAYLSYGTYPEGHLIRGMDDRIWWFDYLPGAGYVWRQPGGGPWLHGTDEALPRLEDPDPPGGSSLLRGIDPETGDGFHLAWARPARGPGPSATLYLVRSGPSAAVEAVLRTPDNGAAVSLVVPIGKHRAFTTWFAAGDAPSLAPALAIIDFDTALFHPIEAADIAALGLEDGLGVARVVLD